jgi:hypothetical protein
MDPRRCSLVVRTGLAYRSMTLRAMGPACAIVFFVSWARADNGYAHATDELASARALFAEALGDEGAGRYAAALEKFKRVQGVKDTPAIEYRLGTCYEGLGKSASAYRSYRAAVLLGQSDPATSDVVSAASTRLESLSRRVARLMVVVPDVSPREVLVRVDGEAMRRETLVEPLALEPGSHRIEASAPGSAPFQSSLTLSEGDQASITVALPPVSHPDETGALESPGARSNSVLPWVFYGAGTLLFAGAAVTLLVRQADIASLDQSCPRGVCPPGSNQSDLESTRNQALIEGPIGVTLAAGGLAAVAFGTYLSLVRHGSGAPRPRHTDIVPLFQNGASGVALQQAF